MFYHIFLQLYFHNNPLIVLIVHSLSLKYKFVILVALYYKLFHQLILHHMQNHQLLIIVLQVNIDHFQSLLLLNLFYMLINFDLFIELDLEYTYLLMILQRSRNHYFFILNEELRIDQLLVLVD